MSDIELLAPAGSFETALAAFDAGADAVYLGLDAYSARADAVNFAEAQLRDLVAYAHQAPRPRKVYVTFNTLLDDAQIPDACARLAALEEIGPDGLIVQDLGVARLVRRHFPGLALHASTQLVAHNLEGVLALRDLGFTRVVLARELSLADIRLIAQRGGCEIETFVHGALCYSLSGLCLFSALEKNRSGNRGRCAYCCRLAYTDGAGARVLPFSMRDLRLDDHLAALRDAGVASLKIEGRMKSPLYVASVTAHYRELLDGAAPATTRADLETVFSRRSTTLYADGYPASPDAASDAVIDPASLGHLGTPIGVVKRVTKDREGRAWLRLHTNRALERHDGLQFACAGDRPAGFGITEMRTALTRTTAFAVPANSDVEILVPDTTLSAPLQPGATVYCSASNAVKRRFPVPSFRAAAIAAGTPVAVAVTLAPNRLAATATTTRGRALTAAAALDAALAPADHPDRTADAVRKAFARLGGTNWRLAACALDDPDHLFAPASALNDLRRRLVDALDAARADDRAAFLAALANERDAPAAPTTPSNSPARVLKLRLGQSLPADVCGYDEVVFAIGHAAGADVAHALADRAAEIRARADAVGDPAPRLRLALPVFTLERDVPALRATVKHLVRAGVTAWEAADLAGLRLLAQLGLGDLTADWTLYALNRPALAHFAAQGVARCVASPENTAENLAALAAASGADGAPVVEFLERQNTPLFISLTRPAIDDPAHLAGARGDAFTAFVVDGLWITTRPAPRRFERPAAATCTRVDLSWDAP